MTNPTDHSAIRSLVNNAAAHSSKQELSLDSVSQGRASERQGVKGSVLQIKANVICMRLFYCETFQEIERKIGMKAAMAYDIWQQAYHLANIDNIVDLLSVLEHKFGAGQPDKVMENIQISATV